MLIGRILGCTRVLGTKQGYIGLPVRDIVVIDNAPNRPDTPAMESAWLPTPREIGAINQGSSVYVRILGAEHPPIMVYVGDRPDQSPILMPNGLHEETLAAAMAIVTTLVESAKIRYPDNPIVSDFYASARKVVGELRDKRRDEIEALLEVRK